MPDLGFHAHINQTTLVTHMEECVSPNYAQSRCSVIFHGYIYPAAIHPTAPQVPSLADTVRSGSFSQVVAIFQLFKNKATTSACLWKLTLSHSMLGGWLSGPRLKFDPFQPICTTCTENLFETNRRKKTFHFCRTNCQSCLKHPNSPHQRTPQNCASLPVPKLTSEITENPTNCRLSPCKSWRKKSPVDNWQGEKLIPSVAGLFQLSCERNRTKLCCQDFFFFSFSFLLFTQVGDYGLANLFGCYF